MSLDVYLRKEIDLRTWENRKRESLAEVGDMKALIPLIEEYYEDRKPSNSEALFNANITHNLGEMAAKAGIYEALWRPHRLKSNYNIPEGDHQAEYDFEDKTKTYAKDIIELLEGGLRDLKEKPLYYKKFDAPNGWGRHEHLIQFVEEYLDACKMYPDAIVTTSR